MGGDDAPGDAEPQPGSAHLPAPRLVHAIESLEHPRQVLGRDPDPGVGDGQVRPVARPTDDDADGPAGGRVLDGVVDQVHRHLPKANRVPVNDDPSRLRLGRESHTLHLGERAKGVRDTAHELTNVDRLGLRGRDARVLSGEGEELVGQAGHPPALLQGALDERAELVRGRRPAQRDFRLRPERGERGPELVRGVGGEPLHLGERPLEPPDHRVHGGGELPELVLRVRGGESFVKAVRGDAIGRSPEGVDGREGRPGEDVGESRRGDEPDRDGEEDCAGEHREVGLLIP